MCVRPQSTSGRRPRSPVPLPSPAMIRAAALLIILLVPGVSSGQCGFQMRLAGTADGSRNALPLFQVTTATTSRTVVSRFSSPTGSRAAAWDFSHWEYSRSVHVLRPVRVGGPGGLLPPATGGASLAHRPGRADEQEPVSGLPAPGGLRGHPGRTLGPPERWTFR